MMVGYILRGPTGLTCNHGRWMPVERPYCIIGKCQFQFDYNTLFFAILENHFQPNIVFTG